MAQDNISRRDRNLARIRDHATTVAERIVLDEGRAALNARTLAREVGVSVGSLYNAFGDLDGVVRSMKARGANRLSGKLREAVAGAKGGRRARVRIVADAYFDFAMAEPRRWWMLIERSGDMARGDEARALEEEILRMLIEAGGGDAEDERHRVFFRLLWASVDGLVTATVRPTVEAIEPETARSYMGDLIDAGFRSFPY